MSINTSEVDIQGNSSHTEQKDNSKEMNFRQLTRQLEEERSARLKLEEELAKDRQERSRKPYKDDDDDYDASEPYIDHKYLKKELNRFASDFEQKVDKKAEEKAAMMIERERQQNFVRSNPDFAQIINNGDLIQKFAEKHPEIAEPMLEMPDNFARQKLLYQNIKALGINKPETRQPTIQETIDKNRRSPYYQPSGGATPPYESQGDFSPEGMKNAYLKQQKLISNRRG